MPTVPELHIGWPLGMQSSSNAINMPEGSLTIARNMDIGADSSIKIRQSLTTVADRIEESDRSQPTIGMIEYQNGSTKQIIRAAGTKWYSWDATGTAMTNTALTGLSAQDADLRVNFVRWRDSLRNWVIGGQKDNDTYYYDGTNITSLGLSFDFKHLAVFAGRLFGAEDGANVLRFSNFSDPTSFRVTSALSLNDRRGGDIDAIGVWQDFLLYGSRNQMNVLTGTDRYSFQITPLPAPWGIVSHESFQATPIGAIWMDEDGLHLFNGTQTTRISSPIDDFFRSIDFTKLTNVWSAFYRSPVNRLHKYVIALSLENVRTNSVTVEYTLETNGWTIRSGDQALALATGHDANDMDVLYASDVDGTLYKWDQPSDTLSPAVDFNIVDRPFNFNHPLAEKMVDRVFIYYQADRTAVLDIRITADFRGETRTYQETLTADTAIPTQYQFDMLPTKKSFLQSMSAREILLEGVGLSGRNFQVQIQNKEGGRSFRIQAIGMEANIDKEHWEPSIQIRST